MAILKMWKGRRNHIRGVIREILFDHFSSQFDAQTRDKAHDEIMRAINLFCR